MAVEACLAALSGGVTLLDERWEHRLFPTAGSTPSHTQGAIPIFRRREQQVGDLIGEQTTGHLGRCAIRGPQVSFDCATGIRSLAQTKATAPVELTLPLDDHVEVIMLARMNQVLPHQIVFFSAGITTATFLEFGALRRHGVCAYPCSVPAEPGSLNGPKGTGRSPARACEDPEGANSMYVIV